jgi:hypothetical protein
MNRQLRQRFLAMRLRTLTGVLLFVFLLRALIPSGYMPANVAGGVMALNMTLCVTGLPAGVMKTLSLEAAGTTPEPQPMVCAFAATISQAVLLLAAAVMAIAIFMIVSSAALPWTRVISTRLVRGPPLGSRAPPVVS